MKKDEKNYLSVEDRVKIYNRLVEAVELLGISEKALAAKFFISQSGLYKLKIGEYQFTADKLFIIATGFGISCDYLLTGNASKGIFFHHEYNNIKDLDLKETAGMIENHEIVIDPEVSRTEEMFLLTKQMEEVLTASTSEQKVKLVLLVVKMCLSNLM